MSGLSRLLSAHPDLLAGGGRVAGVALHEDEMRGREVQRSIRGLVAEAIHQSHLFHLHRTHDRGVKASHVNQLMLWRAMHSHFIMAHHGVCGPLSGYH